MNELIILVSLGLKKRHESDMNIKSIDRREREAKGASRVEQFDFFFKSRCRARAWSNSQTEICIIEFYPFFSNARDVCRGITFSLSWISWYCQ